MGLEIERKFRLPEVPGWVRGCPSRLLEQGYVALGEDEEVRVRLIDGGERAELAVKRGHGERRGETEVELSGEQAAALWPLTEGRRVRKRRFFAERPEGIYEIDVYEGPHAGLVTAEIEFGSEARSRAFEPPGWLGTELTGDRRYANRALAVGGRPPADPT